MSMVFLKANFTCTKYTCSAHNEVMVRETAKNIGWIIKQDYEAYKTDINNNNCVTFNYRQPQV